jgi:2-hydroxychromene-2-carboxylate isomerase
VTKRSASAAIYDAVCRSDTTFQVSQHFKRGGVFSCVAKQFSIVLNSSKSFDACGLTERLHLTSQIDYYFTPQSPWTYLGHARFTELARQAGAMVRVLPADLGQVFAVSGGLPLGQRAPQRQAYRLLELKRFSDSLPLPLHVQPAFFPVAGDAASRLIIAVDQQDGAAAALRLSGAVFSAVWVEERNIADAAVLAQLLAEQGLSAERLAQSLSAEVQQRYQANTQQAIEAGVFGAPSYVLDGELFWGQDRLDFVAQKLASK